MPCSTIVKLCVARHGARADDDPSWAQSDPLARLWDPPLSDTGKEQALSLGDFAASLGVTRLVVSPFSRCLQTAAGVARRILEKKKKEEEEKAKAKVANGGSSSNGGGACSSSPSASLPPPPPLLIEIDLSVCEVLSRECMGGGFDPPNGPDPSRWAWGKGDGEQDEGEGGEEDGKEKEDGKDEGKETTFERRLLSAAAAAGLPRELTSLVASSSEFPNYPETKEEAGTRYLVALAGVAARALAAVVVAKGKEEGEKKKEPEPPITMVVTHGEAVSTATRLTGGDSSKRGRPYAVPPTGVVVLDCFVEEEEDGIEDEGDDCNDKSSAAALSAIACARWELSQAARGVAFE